MLQIKRSSTTSKLNLNTISRKPVKIFMWIQWEADRFKGELKCLCDQSRLGCSLQKNTMLISVYRWKFNHWATEISFQINRSTSYSWASLNKYQFLPIKSKAKSINKNKWHQTFSFPFFLSTRIYFILISYKKCSLSFGFFVNFWMNNTIMFG